MAGLIHPGAHSAGIVQLAPLLLLNVEYMRPGFGSGKYMLCSCHAIARKLPSPSSVRYLITWKFLLTTREGAVQVMPRSSLLL